MSDSLTTLTRAQPLPLPANITSAQPGGGLCYRAELAWGHVRRWYLQRFRREYVRRMRLLRCGEAGECPHEVLDPRDVKFFHPCTEFRWAAADDPFSWRDRLPWARWGLAELQIFAWPLMALTAILALNNSFLAAVPAIVLALIAYFFRDPNRAVPTSTGLVVAPADGKVTDVERIEHDEYVGGPAVRVGIFLSVFDVHINRAPARSRVIWLRYEPGKFTNALRSTSATENESMWIGLEEEEAPHRRMIVRQIAGAIARRIVCDIGPGEVLERGQKFGMIKLGSRTELYVPADEALKLEVAVGDRVKAGSSVLARYESP